MITAAKISNFRGIDSLAIEDFRRLNIFVGRNGVGKTSILEAFAVGATGGRPQYFEHLSRLRSLPPISLETPMGMDVYFGKKSDPIEIRLEDDQAGVFTTKVDRCAASHGMEAGESHLPAPELSGGMALYAEDAAPYRFRYTHPSKTSDPTEHTRIMHLFPGQFRLESDDVCGVCPKGFYLKGGMVNLVHANYLVEDLTRSGKRTELLQMLQAVVPAVIDIFPSAQAQAPLVNIGDAVVPAQVMGGGFVWLLTVYAQILKGNGELSVAVIDEIETGLHYLSMQSMWENLIAILRHMPRLQIFCSTHSEELIEKTLAAFQAKENRDLLRIFRVEKESNQLQVRRMDYEILQTVNELGEGQTHVTG